jgi:hypothetical protein
MAESVEAQLRATLKVIPRTHKCVARFDRRGFRQFAVRACALQGSRTLVANESDGKFSRAQSRQSGGTQSATDPSNPKRL